MQAETVYTSDLNFNLEVWKRELKFHLSELDIFQKKLEEILTKESLGDAVKDLESFQNRIMLERKAIDKLIHRCRSKAGKLHKAQNYKNIDGELQYEKRALHDDLKQYLKLHFEFKEDLMDFFLKWS